MNQKNPKFLVMQSAFIGDVILTTAALEKLHLYYPHAQIDFLVRKGNEGLVKDHPFLKKVYVFDKKGGKFKEMRRLISEIRAEKYDKVINFQRFFSSGLMAAASGAKEIIGFKKNPLSRAFDVKGEHHFSSMDSDYYIHEVERNQALLAAFTDDEKNQPKLYPTKEDYEKVAPYKNSDYVCMAPTSVWFTKQFPAERWVELMDKMPADLTIYLLGAPSDKDVCEQLKNQARHPHIVNLAGALPLLASAALMKDALLNYVNDSAPMHLCSAMNAPTVAIYCSTVPAFGYGPLADFNRIVEVEKPLECRPCGVHGHKKCPKGHFKCGFDIEMNALLKALEEAKAWRSDLMA
ncbi:glycosyltransferase family 9 protein [Persicobacter sp. CCB-QB2]|uniref:glycosyltransferase family 9 protein n=1 Tax=Persicobacter sp. CCB-QB2 TaxID=1561025 RepID=UPI0006A9F288|nr:glycosyltransferase family 9 protein [Persicobacter sp. CCB-QB2]